MIEHYRQSLRGLQFALVVMTVQTGGSGDCCGLESPDTAVSPPAARMTFGREDPFEQRPFTVEFDGRWWGDGVSYGPYRVGQRPGGPNPSDAQLLEDLRIISRHWSLIRTYSSDTVTERVLALIHREQLPLKVMVGAWIDTEVRLGTDGAIEERFPEAVATNRRQVADAIRLAIDYPEIVLAVSVGNETQVSWSFHKVRTSALISYIRQVRAAIRKPVTTADDFRYWVLPDSRTLARELDFIVMHVYAMWNKKQLEDAHSFTKKQHAAVVARHPGHEVVLGEAGWATQKLTYGEQKELVLGQAGEEEQKTFYDAFTRWMHDQKIVSFYFEAFDEPWKGGNDPNEIEKHWGLFRVDRTPKKAMESASRRRHDP